MNVRGVVWEINVPMTRTMTGCETVGGFIMGVEGGELILAHRRHSLIHRTGRTRQQPRIQYSWIVCDRRVDRGLLCKSLPVNHARVDLALAFSLVNG